MRIAAFMVVKNDEFYVDMALKSVLPFVMGVYVQDQMSDDGTYEKVIDLKRQYPDWCDKIYVERIDTGHKERFESAYNEPFWRTAAVEATESIFVPDCEWILKLDGDEIYTSHFFDELERIDLMVKTAKMDSFNAVRVAGDRFISKTRRSVHPTSFETSPEGVKFVDPHTQLWKAGRGVKYISNPAFTRFHPILNPDPHPQLWLEGINNIHLHRTFGPKALAFWQEGGDPPMQGPPYHPPTQADKWYHSAANLGNSEEVTYAFPDYVVEKWTEWGIWE